MVFIMNFNNPRNLVDIEELYDKYSGTNINFILDGFDIGKTQWSVPKKAIPGDTIVFMCAKEARHNFGMATSHIPENYDDGFKLFIEEQKVLYKKYSGYILGYGIVSSEPKEDDGWIMSDIRELHQFENPIHIDEFRGFISISKTNSITYVNNVQWERLKWVINKLNPGTFSDVELPDKDELDREYEESVIKERKRPERQLRKEAEKRNSKGEAVSVKTKVYHRDPVIAAYVKVRANGHCQLCGKEAPFLDQNGNPYLECHHINWLSNGGEDSIGNCVALCPNCHRKMHIFNDSNDIIKLKSSIDQTV